MLVFGGSGVANAVYSTLGFIGQLRMVWYISKALGLQSGSQVAHNKSVPKFVNGAM